MHMTEMCWQEQHVSIPNPIMRLFLCAMTFQMVVAAIPHGENVVSPIDLTG